MNLNRAAEGFSKKPKHSQPSTKRLPLLQSQHFNHSDSFFDEVYLCQPPRKVCFLNRISLISSDTLRQLAFAYTEVLLHCIYIYLCICLWIYWWSELLQSKDASRVSTDKGIPVYSYFEKGFWKKCTLDNPWKVIWDMINTLFLTL